MLVYEPETSQRGPVPIARLDDPTLAVMVARSVLAQAEARAQQISKLDGFLGEIENAEVSRLRQILTLLIPGLNKADGAPKLPSEVM